MNQMKALLTRELQEQRGVVLYLPLALCAFYAFVLIVALGVIEIGDGKGLRIEYQDRDQQGQVRFLELGEYWRQQAVELEDMSPRHRGAAINRVYGI
ncbi:MAG: hypothetical protein KDI19_10000, partial [Pseudomonadales bacterium]|nr:hypothetical protein [Pseudomonadales bacterium]